MFNNKGKGFYSSKSLRLCLWFLFVNKTRALWWVEKWKKFWKWWWKKRTTLKLLDNNKIATAGTLVKEHLLLSSKFKTNNGGCVMLASHCWNFWCRRSPSALKIRRENGDDGTFSRNIQIPKNCGGPVCAALWLGLSEPLVKRWQPSLIKSEQLFLHWLA